MADSGGSREINRTGELGEKRERPIERRRGVVADRRVERLGGDVLLGTVRDSSLDPGGNRLHDGRMKQTGVGGAGKLVRQELRLLGGDVEPEYLDRHQPVTRRLVGAKNRAEGANADLMQDPKRAERGRWSECDRVVYGHSGEDKKM